MDIVVHSTLKRGASAVHLVPPGAIELRLHEAGVPVVTHHTTVAAGQAESFVLTPDR